ncbi:MAG: FG-GAP-like repeat-containing protein [Acidobacteriota bacterium]
MIRSRILLSWLAIFLLILFPSAPASAADQFLDRTFEVGLSGYAWGTGDKHGPGGAFADLNGDGYPELVLPAGASESNAILIYRNDPDFGGRKFTKTVLVSGTSQRSTGIIAGDYDNDGDLDLYVLYHPFNTEFPSSLPAVGNFVAPNKLFRNNGNLSFTEITAAGVADAVEDGIILDNSLTAAWADVDRDGDLDLFVGNHNGFGLGGTIEVEETPSDPAHASHMTVGQRDILYLNNGDGTFTDVTVLKRVEGYEDSAGDSIDAADDRWYASTNAVIFGDFNEDGWPDLVVSNKTGNRVEDMLYLNKGLNDSGLWRGFRTETWKLHDPNAPNPLLDFPETLVAPMGVDAGDFDNDGDLDLYFTTVGHNDLFINRTNELGTFDLERPNHGQLDASFSWGTKWLDVNNDGRLDLHVTTSNSHDDYLYIQDVSGNFTDQAASWQALNPNKDTRADLAADYDQDGDLDLFVLNLGAPLFLENQVDPGTDQRYLTLELEGDPSLAGAPYRTNSAAIGARAYVTTGTTTQMREVVSGSGNAASTSDLSLHFGVDKSTTAQVEVEWPSGRVQNLGSQNTNARLTVTETAGSEVGTIMGEVGLVHLTHIEKTIPLARTYANPVVLVQPPSFRGSDPSVIRITDISSNQFTIFVDESPELDGTHTLEDVSYIVLEAGNWLLPDGTRLEVGTLDTNDTVGVLLPSTWATVSFTAGFSQDPVVISQVQSNNDLLNGEPRYVKTRHDNVTASGFQVALERQDSNTQAHGTETIGYLAIEPGSGFWGSHPFVAESLSPQVNHNFQTIEFARSLGMAPQFLASISTYNGAEAASLRYTELKRTSVRLKVEEDTSATPDVNHVNEGVGYLAIGTAGPLAATSLGGCTAPAISQDPLSQTVAAGSSVTFSVVASGTAPLTYQWLKNGFALPGQNGTSLTLASVTSADQGSYSVRVSNACGILTSSSATLTVTTTNQSPFGGTAAVIPGVVQAEAYDLGGQNVAYFDTTAGNTGNVFRTDDVDITGLGGGNYAIGWVAGGEWLEYTVNVPTAGYYNLSARVATPGSGRSLNFEIDGSVLVSGVAVPNTGGWGSFQSTVAQSVFLAAGNSQVLRMEMPMGGVNIDDISFTQGMPPMTTIATDNFNGVAAGTALHNRVTTTGGKVWNANAPAVFGTGFVTASGGPNATIPHNPGNKLVIVEAELDLSNSGWIALGFTENIDQGWWVDGQVWVNLHGSGKYRVLANGTSNPVTNLLDIPGYVPGAYVHVELRYDPSNRHVTLLLDGTEVLSPTQVSGGYVPVINRAGWSALGSTLNQTRLDDFELRQAQ